ncbi:MAG: hypothetical protein NT004_10515 [Bacteroidetes bacterium]|nr:hypothetical protein [Bacteroidota bacterium]
MKVSNDKSFSKDMDGISDKKIRAFVADVIVEVAKAGILSAIGNCKNHSFSDMV